METGLLITAIFTAAFTMVAKRLSSTVVTAPMIFLGFGFALSQTGLMPREDAQASLHLVAEIALIVLLFLDAAKVDLDALRKRHVWPLRMLTVGLPLSGALGTLAAMALLPACTVVCGTHRRPGRLRGNGGRRNIRRPVTIRKRNAVFNFAEQEVT
tara:strand:+ start:129 stop:596 length:468 start_codon:yes stop_codon:yes gene_type:complete